MLLYAFYDINVLSMLVLCKVATTAILEKVLEITVVEASN